MGNMQTNLASEGRGSIENEHEMLPGNESHPTMVENDTTELQQTLARQKKLLFDLQLQIENMRSGRIWKLILHYYNVRDQHFPIGSQRRKHFDWIIDQTVEIGKYILRNRGDAKISTTQYMKWIKKHEPNITELAAQRTASFQYEPKISIAVPTYNTPIVFLRSMIDSVIAQTYGNWELCLADGSDSSSECRKLLKKCAEEESRIRLATLPDNLGISGNSNAALGMVTGDYVAFLDHDDILAPHALHEIVLAINKNPSTDFIYSDEDKISEDGKTRFDPHFKPDWSPDSLRSHNYICHLLVLHRELLAKIGQFREGFDGSQDYDLILRASEKATRIEHLPKILYHWRSHGTSTAGDPTSKLYAYQAARRALEAHLERMGNVADVNYGNGYGLYQVTYRNACKPLISMIVPNRDNHDVLARCINSIKQSNYPAIEILIVENNSRDSKTFEYYRSIENKPNIKILRWNSEFNYAAINNFASKHANGQIFLFLNNDVEARNKDWLERMSEHAIRSDVGAVGAKLYYPGGSIQHAGIALGMRGLAGHPHRYHSEKSAGYCNHLIITRNVSGVTGACLMMRRSVFEQIGGFDEQFAVDYNDVDLCLKIRDRGYSIVWTPFAQLWHHECKTRGRFDTSEKRALHLSERTLFLAKWNELIQKPDPYYNPNLTLDDESLSLAS
jgi:GT2 family glycosyltransferase